MATTTMTFDEVALRGYKRVKCASCGKRLTRQRKFWQTLSPFNKKKDGSVKYADDIRAELRAECASWEREPEICSACAKG